ncbi:1,4-dihydroxy-6-naphthoate synthase [Desulfogranum mediterraneum]|uniref:1,4-dihydroxy-6-naphthoate synthase n=1 Tax=Desulfogranum mediterraneum TaxID=160661 RepID=UPI00041C127D|nr:1,4-dihydroxy-6-naphthoate synthase [Desulfogranum mediterraneum]
MKQEPQRSIGYSPCPNDTYIFYGLIHGQVPLSGLRLGPPVLDDVETLNRWAKEGRLDVTKLSFHALGHVLEHYSLLHAGAALGRGCGPLLVTGNHDKPAQLKEWKIAVPGNWTTAALLLRLYQPGCSRIEVMRFEQIMAAVATGRVDAGVIIHESRFTYQQQGLECVQDLGQWWEEATGHPIPLGCIAAKRDLPVQEVAAIDGAIQASLRWAMAHPEQCGDYIRAHAQELEEEVVRSHIRLYVNEFSLDLGRAGVAAVEELLQRGMEAGVFAREKIQGRELFRSC